MSHRAARRGRIWRTLLAWVGAALLVATAALAWGWTRLEAPDRSDTETVEFEVLPGWGAATVAERLDEAGLIRSPWAFRAWLRLNDLDRALGEGAYDLAPAMDARRVAERLAAGGRPRTVRLVMPEGWRARDLARRADALGIAPADAILARVDDPGELTPDGAPDDVGLEGYLYPDSYELRPDTEASALLQRLVQRFEERIERDGMAERAAEQDLDLHAWVTLASMVQAEAAGPHEMAIIAGVFRNRLEIGMLLQSDPTVAYGLGKTLPELDFPGGDFDVDHPWNTYTRSGLPRGPIGSPGSDALAAVLAPDRTAPSGEPWMYFLHGRDADADVFRPNTTFEDHVRDVNRYLR
ncbi:MAG: endolytic transglycosylase MltG [Trueperaceae bacterium]